MKIAVTGSTSSIGTHLINRLAREGYDIVPLGGRSSNLWRIGMKFPEFLDVDVLIHPAHDRTLTLNQNIDATNLLISSFQGQKIFLSSLSAHLGTKSIYGKSKYESERLFLSHGGKVIRAGLVFGPNISGIFLTLKKMANVLPILPLPYSGTSRMYMTHIDDLCEELTEMISREEKGIVLGAHFWPVTLKDLVRRIRKQSSSPSFQIIVPIPRLILEILRRCLSPLKLRVPLIDSLSSLSVQINSEEFSSMVPASNNFRMF